MTDRPAECAVIELRRYVLHPGGRDVLIELFEREFIAPQEAGGMAVLGQFRDCDHDDRFVWLRGFADMASRPAALEAFYGGPVWRAHREVANATMIDSDDVLLLRPAWPGAGDALGGGRRAPPGATALPGGVLLASVLHLRAPADDALVAACREVLAPALVAGGAQVLGTFVSEAATNNFPRLPVREGVSVAVVFALFEDRHACAQFEGGAASRAASAALTGIGVRAIERLRLAPTPRSAIRAGAPS